MLLFLHTVTMVLLVIHLNILKVLIVKLDSLTFLVSISYNTKKLFRNLLQLKVNIWHRQKPQFGHSIQKDDLIIVDH